MSSIADRALGCFLGAAVGDAAGAPLEHFHVGVTDEHVRSAMSMPGGGHLTMGPGQITDDTELALAMAWVLKDHQPSDGFPTHAMAKQYAGWLSSDPFDVGTTCSRAFGQAHAGVCLEQPAGLAQLLANVASLNKGSEANGAIMRASPLAVWCHALPAHMAARYAAQDAVLSHPSPAAVECNAVYVLMLVHLIKHGGDAAGALAAGAEYVREHVRSAEVHGWFEDDSRAELESLGCRGRSFGWVRWAFTIAVSLLRAHVVAASSFERHIAATLRLGGDTDTNAAVVGGMMGALLGASGIPDHLKRPVLAFDPSGRHGGRVRPAMYAAAHIPALVTAFSGPTG